MTVKLTFGLSAAVPEDVTTAWGARLIAPDDLLHDRQDLVAASDDAKAALVAWLNGKVRGQGAISKALDYARENYSKYGTKYAVTDISGREEEQHTLYEDDRGIIVGNTNGSCGYLYVAAWLHPELSIKSYHATRGNPISAERWEVVYGWPVEEASKMDNTGGEVRCEVRGDGERRFLDHVDHWDEGKIKDGSLAFEFGYGGTGPHALAAAIVRDALDLDTEPAPDTLRKLVPEVFDCGHNVPSVTVTAADVQLRAASCAAIT